MFYIDTYNNWDQLHKFYIPDLLENNLQKPDTIAQKLKLALTKAMNLTKRGQKKAKSS